MQLEQLGPYRLGKKLGQGGMGAVYEGVDVTTGQSAAVKVLAPALAAEEGFRARFEAEIESLKKLKHPNIVRLYGYGEQGGVLFYAMELVPGTSLEDELREGRRFEWREVTQLSIKLCRALKHAHDHGVIHRDIKPANLLLTEDGEIKLSDFGIARLFGNVRMTSEGGLLGTAEYMAPEQAAGHMVTDRCDQYSLGGVMYALLAGRPPFCAGTLVEMLQLQRYGEPQPVRRYAPNTPQALETIIQQLLAKDPDKRFANTMLLGRALEAMEHGLTVTATRGDEADFELSEPDKPQSAITGLDPFAATLVTTDKPRARDDGYELDSPVTEATLAATESGLGRQTTKVDVAESPGRFTKVEEEDRGVRGPWYAELAAAFGSLQTVGLAAGLLVVVVGAWFALRPPSADRLYDDIEALVRDGRAEEAASQIDSFVERFPDDPRNEEVAGFRDQLEMAGPVERAYLEANRLVRLNPELAMARFQALVDVYDDATLVGEPAGKYVRQARQQLKRLKKQMADEVQEDLRLVETRLRRAESLSASDPAAARKIWQGIIDLYGGKRWAATVVAQARAALAGAEEQDSSTPGKGAAGGSPVRAESLLDKPAVAPN